MIRENKRQGFTLIELLIVVAIIAILAAIAVPNFLEAQTRSKVSRVKADMRTLMTAIEAYLVDNNDAPVLELYKPKGKQINRGGVYNVTGLSTPIAYLSSTAVLDPFVPHETADEFADIMFIKGTGEVSKTINYIQMDLARKEANKAPIETKYCLLSYGPDYERGSIPGINKVGLGTYAVLADREAYFAYAGYDPSNGTVSGGDIFRYQGR
jgi:prepilin-type N-terminal cleavage/methylation domain-containing protein